jgi:hypothetical protein
MILPALPAEAEPLLLALAPAAQSASVELRDRM